MSVEVNTKGDPLLNLVFRSAEKTMEEVDAASEEESKHGGSINVSKKVLEMIRDMHQKYYKYPKAEQESITRVDATDEEVTDNCNDTANILIEIGEGNGDSEAPEINQQMEYLTSLDSEGGNQADGNPGNGDTTSPDIDLHMEYLRSQVNSDNKGGKHEDGKPREGITYNSPTQQADPEMTENTSSESKNLRVKPTMLESVVRVLTECTKSLLKTLSNAPRAPQVPKRKCAAKRLRKRIALCTTRNKLPVWALSGNVTFQLQVEH